MMRGIIGHVEHNLEPGRASAEPEARKEVALPGWQHNCAGYGGASCGVVLSGGRKFCVM